MFLLVEACYPVCHKVVLTFQPLVECHIPVMRVWCWANICNSILAVKNMCLTLWLRSVCIHACTVNHVTSHIVSWLLTWHVYGKCEYVVPVCAFKSLAG